MSDSHTSREYARLLERTSIAESLAQIREKALVEAQKRADFAEEEVRRLQSESRLDKEERRLMALDIDKLTIENARLQKQTHWQPVETAPRDGTVILLLQGFDAVVAGFFNHEDKGHPWSFLDVSVFDGTNLNAYKKEAVIGWRPLPSPESEVGK